jgi:hypothetical protein
VVHKKYSNSSFCLLQNSLLPLSSKLSLLTIDHRISFPLLKLSNHLIHHVELINWTTNFLFH